MVIGECDLRKDTISCLLHILTSYTNLINCWNKVCIGVNHLTTTIINTWDKYLTKKKKRVIWLIVLEASVHDCFIPLLWDSRKA